MIREFTENKPSEVEGSQGFTLIEVLIALTIFAIGIMGVFKMQVIGMQGTGTTRTYLETAEMAQDKAEDLLHLAYADPILVGSAAGTTYGPNVDGPYSWSYTVYDDLTANTTNSKTIVVQTTHPNGRNAEYVFVKPDF